ncbi:MULTISPECIES: cobyrinate a,c-diamide synthase [unclassified Acidovorax]|uniref:cobyrinate a,c-diamide synthase n=1 Tax=unclassified Acidovorax TaxID=2684926 RepID=UPI000BD614C8|nr:MULTISPECIES: cobyrinate a,c-diamide synthase [unclassified Acidovorax]HQS20319.1 cobyrinate a,c-diamide synthase [Acidovorax defluvii]OYY28569.1 MAG: cobyrinic acid a,c-diamide synthase [Acidovorax sp. 35-64-16]OYZ70151.1 MAG: cobyrinic acid a,c-diamide synthase [Acidovorax sp. 24-64-9]OZA71568.1 MAG: cobyrinic acid a,c-diamide synthase [Acidovorax sp. 39-64-12]HQS63283.1 cobyrinate a,c-diamide synthase [Acidovorax defluvii]
MTPPSSARCPALLVAAPASGQGKTTVTAALARLHARRGLQVRVFKCGPDFLDPHWHQLASGAPVHQLDLWMTGEADCARRLHAAAQEADLILIEGVMGLFDGDPSAADLAQRFGVPVLAVVDASAMAGTFGALAFGLRHYRPGLPWAGVLANRVGSARHADMLQAGLREPQDWLGALMRVTLKADVGVDVGAARAAGALLPERHLGLVAAHELLDSQQRLDAAADALAATPLGQMTAQDLQRWAVDFPAPAHTAAVPALLAGRTVAVARDAAFCFIYAANVQCLTQMGARVVFFSPLHDAALPHCDAVWLPGGYPELHTAQIVANTGMQASLCAHVAAGKALWAECGGMMALFESITLADGSTAPLWGLLPGQVTMQKRLAALGPQQLAVAGHTLRGHTFHYSTCDSSATVVARTARPGEVPAPDAGEALYQQGSIHASYFHAWFPSSPEAVAHLMGGVPL